MHISIKSSNWCFNSLQFVYSTVVIIVAKLVKSLQHYHKLIRRAFILSKMFRMLQKNSGSA
uniref:Uncharacterized protein n=1 Tax=Anguilla anguilla TaxID=7936 RepID=A0A0E9SDB4_ANGAN